MDDSSAANPRPAFPLEWRLDSHEAMFECDKLEAVLVNFDTPEGARDFLAIRLEHHPKFAQYTWNDEEDDDDEDQDTQILDTVFDEVDFHCFKDLPPGRYHLRCEGLSWVPHLDTLDTIPERPVEFAETIDPEDIPNHSQFAVYSADAVDVKEAGNGLGVGTLKDQASEPKLFVKYSVRKFKDDFIREVEALSNVDHPSIIKLFGLLANSDGDIIGLLIPYAQSGDLGKHKSASDRQKITWVLQVIDALIYLKNRGQPYTDIKCSNVLVDDNGRAVLADFDGGYTRGKYKEGSESFGLAVMLKDLNCAPPEIGVFIEDAKQNMLSLEVCQERLHAVLAGL